ncbi:MAG: helix-turn-helix transcriptional regulator [Candidatus Pacebacteria bacterium]|nr:helix-turn-helix transcriptional regulator [Candidatus Paceibacterota bacterium]
MQNQTTLTIKISDTKGGEDMVGSVKTIGKNKSKGILKPRKSPEIQAQTPIGKFIRKERKRRKLTLRKLASLSNISASHLGRIEQGKRNPSGVALVHLSPIFDVPVEKLFVTAGFMSQQTSPDDAACLINPEVKKALEQETFKTQRAVVAIFGLIKVFAELLNTEDG